MPQDLPTTIALLAGLLIAAAATVASWRRWRRASAEPGRVFGVWAVVALATGLLIYRAVQAGDGWRPLDTHVDGLLLLVGLLGLAVGYLRTIGRMRGLELFAWPIVTVALAWAVCASWWTFDTSRFDIAGVWDGLHIASVYLGVAAAGLAAATGAMYLVADRQLRRRDDPARVVRLLGRMASLEAIEANLMRSATAGFILLTLALGLGIVQATTTATSMGESWWASTKVWGAAAAWAALGLIMHARVAPRLRGHAAAAISLVGFVVLLAVLAVALSMSGCANYDMASGVGAGPEVVSSQGN